MPEIEPESPAIAKLNAGVEPLPGFLLADARTESTFDEIPVMLGPFSS